ncbi:hypothetical protein Q4574_14705 [Aliiglaciecola sp. 3_MG-2023]|uniref:hypothetical protein n=1 Tax=Aliiglaciecola sp. 3_MG-2023 TaxID=3062644 RepID=UPI0026E29B60|nr:hypothetical protein [Aliiglaciecola sp. 3_MG-2023]MDO6694544.1 hypothetical protein [Aliiglaciecola sp. 3_MG-2023]
MKTYITIILIAALNLFQVAKATDTIVVVANVSDRSIQLNRQQIRNLYMGGMMSSDLDVIALPPDNITRMKFNTKVLGLTESRIQSYWAQMRFTGRTKAPKEFDDEHSLLEYIKQHEGTLGYLPASTSIPSDLMVVYTVQ